MAYYNLGASYEHQSNMVEAIGSYEKAFSIADKQLGPENPLTKTIKDNLDQAIRKHFNASDENKVNIA